MEAIIVLNWHDDKEKAGASCWAFTPDVFETVGVEPIFSKFVPFDSDAPYHNDDAMEAYEAFNELEATLPVLGWLWKHRYTSARWGDPNNSPDEDSCKPSWASKEIYEWSPVDADAIALADASSLQQQLNAFNKLF